MSGKPIDGNGPENSEGQSTGHPKSKNKLPIIWALYRYVAYRKAKQEAQEANYKTPEALLAYRQLCASKWLNRITGIGTIVALGGLGFLGKSIIDAEDATIQANRALVSPLSFYFTQDAVVGQSIPIRFEYRNIGRQPTNDTKISVFFDTTPITPGLDMRTTAVMNDTFCETNPPTERLGTVYPVQEQSSMTMNTRIQKINWDTEMDQSTKALRMRECITYVTFGQHHKTWFCEIFGPSLVSDPKRRIGVSCRGGDGAD